MHKPESVWENEMHKTPGDFEIQTARKPDIVLINNTKKKEKLFIEFCRYDWLHSENKRKRNGGKYLDFAREPNMEHEGGTVILIIVDELGMVPKGLEN